LATEAAAAAGVSVVGVGKCPDPSSPDGYGPEISSPPAVIFNPAAYTYFRWTGTVTYARSFNPSPVTITSTTGWYTRSTALHGRMEIFNLYPPSVPKFNPPPGPLAAWSSSFSLSFDMTNAFPPSCNVTNWNGIVAGVSVGGSGGATYFPSTQVYSTCYAPQSFPLSDFIMSASGVWQFSNNASTVIATWDGV
jgi:hypothetical protein